MTLIPKEMEYPREIREAFEVANQLSWTKEELDAYDKKGIYIQDERGRVEYAREEGIEEGKALGIEAGERSKALKVAKELLNSGISIDIIIKATGLTETEIRE